MRSLPHATCTPLCHTRLTHNVHIELTAVETRLQFQFPTSTFIRASTCFSFMAWSSIRLCLPDEKPWAADENCVMTEMKPWTEALMYWSVSARRDVSCFISSTAQGDFNGRRSPLITVIAASLQSMLIVQQRIIVTLHCGPLTMSECLCVHPWAPLSLQTVQLCDCRASSWFNYCWNLFGTLGQIIKQRFYSCPLAARKNTKHDLNHCKAFGFMLIFTTCLPFPSFCCAKKSQIYYTHLKYFGYHHN